MSLAACADTLSPHRPIRECWPCGGGGGGGGAAAAICGLTAEAMKT